MSWNAPQCKSKLNVNHKSNGNVGNGNSNLMYSYSISVSCKSPLHVNCIFNVILPNLTSSTTLSLSFTLVEPYAATANLSQEAGIAQAVGSSSRGKHYYLAFYRFESSQASNLTSFRRQWPSPANAASREKKFRVPTPRMDRLPLNSRFRPN